MTEHARPPTPRAVRLALGLAGFAVLVVAGWIVYLTIWGNSESQQKDAAQVEKTQAQEGETKAKVEKRDLAAEVKAACDAGGTTGKNLRQRGLCGKVTEIVKQPIEGRVGKTGPPPSDAQVQQAVNSYCASGRCDAKSPTMQQVASAVAAYCNARGQCTPPKPADGKDGENATAAQIASAVASFCADDACDGDDGKDGENGRNGRDVSISVTDLPNGKRITVSYSDDTPSVSFDILNGEKGEKGEPSVVPGPPGPPGPACPEGYHLETRTIVSAEVPTGEEAQLCTKNAEQP